MNNWRETKEDDSISIDELETFAYAKINGIRTVIKGTQGSEMEILITGYESIFIELISDVPDQTLHKCFKDDDHDTLYYALMLSAMSILQNERREANKNKHRQ